MTYKNRWFYLEYITTWNCPKCGILGSIQAGMIMGSLVFKCNHYFRISARLNGKSVCKRFIYKVCYF